MITKKMCSAVLSIISLRKTFYFLTKVISIRELSKIFKDYGGKFEDIMLFQGLFKARANHVINLQLFLKLLISFIPRMGC